MMLQGTLQLLMRCWLMQTVGKRAVIVSGMNAVEISEVIGAYRDTGMCLPSSALHMMEAVHSSPVS